MTAIIGTSFPHILAVAIVLGLFKCMPTHYFTCMCFTPFFFNTPCQFTSLVNIPTLIFGLTPLGWLHSIMLTHYIWWEYYFWFMPTFSGMQLGHKTGAGCVRAQYLFPAHGVPSVWNRKVINYPGALCSSWICLFVTFYRMCCCLGTD
jgi:uncharacterized membrane-anchored protein YitT (DUF2179 family)